MAIYLAFLRGINVGGQKLIRMKELNQIVSSIKGFSDINTYIQSGNISFKSMEKNVDTLERKMENHLQQHLGYAVTVMIRHLSHMRQIIEDDPFSNLHIDPGDKLYASFLKQGPQNKVVLPVFEEKEGLEIIRITGQEVFVISRQKQSGGYGFPNNFVEKEFGIVSTTRNMNTLIRILQKLKS